MCSSRSNPILISPTAAPIALVLDNDVQGMNDSRNEAQQGQQDVEPEMAFEADLQEYAERRQDNGKKNLERISRSDGHRDLLRINGLLLGSLRLRAGLVCAVAQEARWGLFRRAALATPRAVWHGATSAWRMLAGGSNGLSISDLPGLSCDCSLTHRSAVHAMVQRNPIEQQKENNHEPNHLDRRCSRHCPGNPGISGATLNQARASRLLSACDCLEKTPMARVHCA